MADEDQADEQLADEQPAEVPAPRVAGAIGRGVVDAAAAYERRLAEVWAAATDPGPWND